MTSKRALVVVSGDAVPGAHVSNFIAQESLNLDSIDFASSSSVGTDKKYEIALSVATNTQHNAETLGKVSKVLAPGAKLIVVEDTQVGFLSYEPIEHVLFSHKTITCNLNAFWWVGSCRMHPEHQHSKKSCYWAASKTAPWLQLDHA